jgi:hypothetical protein
MDSATIPMPSARLGSGRYEVLGTSGAVEARREGRYWFLILGDSPAKVGPFATKRAALVFCQENPQL